MPRELESLGAYMLSYHADLEFCPVSLSMTSQGKSYCIIHAFTSVVDLLCTCYLDDSVLQIQIGGR
jgi:hypothetical protein